MAGQNDLMAWLQSVMPNAGAQQPYDPRQNPSLTPTAGVPGGGLLGYSAATPGQPSMGYPALGQPGAAPQPHPSAGSSFNPFDWLFPPAAAAEAPAAQPSRAFAGGTPPLAANALPLAWGNPTSDDYRKWLEAQQADGSPPAPAPGAAPASRGGSGYGGVPPSGWSASDSRGGSGYGAVPPGGWGETSPPLPPPRPAAGSPSKTPRPADRWLIDRVNAGPLAQPRRGYQTALDLSSLFRRG